jgi:hypothetical protein
MMTTIETYDQLKAAKAISKQRIKLLEQEIRDDVEEIKNDLKPVNVAVNTVRNMLSSEKHGLVSETLNLSVNALVKGLLFRNTSFVTKTLIAFAAKNFANNMVMKNSDNILDWLQAKLRSLKSKDNDKHKHNGHYFDESTANVDLEN